MDFETHIICPKCGLAGVSHPPSCLVFTWLSFQKYVSKHQADLIDPQECFNCGALVSLGLEAVECK